MKEFISEWRSCRRIPGFGRILFRISVSVRSVIRNWIMILCAITTWDGPTVRSVIMVRRKRIMMCFQWTENRTVLRWEHRRGGTSIRCSEKIRRICIMKWRRLPCCISLAWLRSRFQNPWRRWKIKFPAIKQKKPEIKKWSCAWRREKIRWKIPGYLSSLPDRAQTVRSCCWIMIIRMICIFRKIWPGSMRRIMNF